MIKHSSISSLLLIVYVFAAILFYGSSLANTAQLIGALLAITFFIEIIFVNKIKLSSNIKKFFYPSLVITFLSFFSLISLPGAESRFLTLFQVNVLAFILIYKTTFNPKVFKQILLSYISALFVGSLFSIGTIDVERDGSMFGSAVNLYGTAINLGVLFSCFLLLDKFSSTNASKLTKLKTLFYISYLLCTILLFANKVYFHIGSKKSIIIFTIIIIYFLFTMPKKYFKKQVILLFLILFYYGSTLIQNFTNSNHFYRFQKFYDSLIYSNSRDLSTDNRLEMINIALDRFWQKPIFGYGIDSFRILTNYPSYSHNNFVEILHNFGIIGFLTFYYVHFVILYFVLSKWKSLFKKDRFLILASILCLLINDLTVVSYYVKIPMILLSILIGRFIFLKQELLNGR
jgi:O-antigen ligase